MLMSRPRIDCICRSGKLHQVSAEERDAARFDAGVRREQPHDRERRDALAGAAFADDAERAALLEAESEVVDGADDAFFGVEVGAEVGDFEDGSCHRDSLFNHKGTKSTKKKTSSQFPSSLFVSFVSSWLY